MGSLGEWFSGFGSFAAVVAALWISSHQRRHAAAILADERKHAASVLEDQRRYDAEQNQKRDTQLRIENRAADYQALGNYLIALEEGIRKAKHVGRVMAANPEDFKLYGNALIEMEEIKHTSRVLDAIRPHDFKSIAASTSAHKMQIMWAGILSNFRLALKASTIDDVAIRLVDISNVKKNLQEIMEDLLDLRTELPPTAKEHEANRAKAKEMVEVILK